MLAFDAYSPFATLPGGVTNGGIMPKLLAYLRVFNLASVGLRALVGAVLALYLLLYFDAPPPSSFALEAAAVEK
jgi:hypothetical protein